MRTPTKAGYVNLTADDIAPAPADGAGKADTRAMFAGGMNRRPYAFAPQASMTAPAGATAPAPPEEEPAAEAPPAEGPDKDKKEKK